MAIHFAYSKEDIAYDINLTHADDYEGDETDYYVGDTIRPSTPQSNAAIISPCGGRFTRIQRNIRPYDPDPSKGQDYSTD